MRRAIVIILTWSLVAFSALPQTWALAPSNKLQDLYIYPDKRTLALNERMLKAEDYPNLLAAILAQYRLQMRAGHFNKESKAWESFYKIIEDGKTVEYAVYLKGEPMSPRVFQGDVPPEVLRQAEFVFVQNVGRARKPAWQGSEQPRVDPYSPAMRRLAPEALMSAKSQEVGIIWQAPSGHPWWLGPNPFAIWPQRQGAPMDAQPFALTLSRFDGDVYQWEMSTLENLRDVVAFITRLNSSPGLKGKVLFRGAINGWYSKDGKVKAGASQSQAHAQLVRFYFPIEHAQLSKPVQIGRIGISSLADGFGTGLVIEAPSDALGYPFIDLIFRAIELITEKGHSFNPLVAPGKDGGLRIFIADRTMGTPERLFPNEWGVYEVVRAFIVDAPTIFYEMTQGQRDEFEPLPKEEQDAWTRAQREAGALSAINPALREKAIESLKMVTAPQAEIDAIIQRLQDEFPGGDSGFSGEIGKGQELINASN